MRPRAGAVAWLLREAVLYKTRTWALDPYCFNPILCFLFHRCVLSNFVSDGYRRWASNFQHPLAQALDCGRREVRSGKADKQRPRSNDAVAENPMQDEKRY